MICGGPDSQVSITLLRFAWTTFEQLSTNSKEKDSFVCPNELQRSMNYTDIHTNMEQSNGTNEN